MPSYEITYYEDLSHKIVITAESDAHAQKFLDYLLDGAISPEDADRAPEFLEGITYGNCSTERMDTGLVDYDERLDVVS